VFRRAFLVLLAAAVAMLVPAPAAQATVYTVTTTDDLPGSCSLTPSDCSLRQAVNGASEDSDADMIHVPAGTFALEPSLGPLSLSGGGWVTIAGAGAGATIVSGRGGTRVVDVAASGLATITGLAVTDGNSPSQGGGIGVAGQLVLESVIVSGNRASAPSADGAGGGGIVNGGRLTVANSAIFGNVAGAGSAAGGAGGGIYHAGTALEITNSTITGNVAEAGAGSGGSGGGIYSSGDSVLLRNVTLASNSAPAGSGGNIAWSAGLVIFSNTIVSGGVAANGINCAGSPGIAVTGTNLESADSCGFGTGLRNVDPQLAPLAANGGPTPTMALGAGSPAIDAGSGCPPPDTDQRGVLRPQGSSCDIGAYEAPPQVRALARDTTKPALSRLRISPRRVRALGGRGSSIARKRRRGATVRYRLSEPAAVTFTVEHAVQGVRVGRGCLRQSRAGADAAAHRRRCTTYKHLKGSFTHSGITGANKFKFTGRLRKKRLKRGRYRLVAVARDPAGNRSRPKRKRFRIVR
jgi:CSLREA domain-containing protein